MHQPAIVSADNEADERIGRDIGDLLATAKSLEGKHVLVEVEDGEVFLRGTVTDETVRSEVERLSSSVRAAKCIHNELDVLN
jgi:osmotically-inducible protein OsmY